MQTFLYYPYFCKYLVGWWRVVTNYVVKSTVKKYIKLKTAIVDIDGLFFISLQINCLKYLNSAFEISK